MNKLEVAKTVLPILSSKPYLKLGSLSFRPYSKQAQPEAANAIANSEF